MLLTEYIQAKLKGFGVQLSDTELTALFIDISVSDGAEYETTLAKKALIQIIPELLVRPDISEGDLSIKFNKDAISQYYNLLCKDLGVDNKLFSTPKIRVGSL